MPHIEDRSSLVRLRPPTVDDAPSIWKLARDSGALDLNSQYAYLVLCRDFAATSLVAEKQRHGVVGFVVGYRPPARSDTIFVWQVAVARDERGRGLGLKLLEQLVDRVSAQGADRLEATVTASNAPSQRLFRALASSRDAALEIEPLFEQRLFGDGHEEEQLLRIGPFAPTAPVSQGSELSAAS